MELKRLFIVFAVIGVLFMGFTSCSSDDDDKKAPIVGTWKLKITNDENGVKVADMITDLEFGEGGEAMKAMILGTLAQNGADGKGIAAKVEYVNVTFAEDEKLYIAFKEVGAAQETNITDLVELNYYTSADGKIVYIAVKKELIAGLLPLLGADIDIAQFQSLFVETDKFYAIPLNVEIENNYAKFYVKKDYIAKVAAVADAMGLVPVDYKPLVEWAAEMANNADVTMNVGLGFVKQ